MPTTPTREIVTLSGELHLVPVVEFEPGSYARQERPRPGGSGEEVPRDWQHYWEQSLADSGLHLEPLFSGSWFVPISRLTDPHVLRQMLRIKLETIDSAEPVELFDRVIAMSGGQVLFEGEHVVLTPRCCGDLSDLENWEAAARREPDGFWIGHPQVFASWEEPWLLLREEEPDRNGVHRAWHLSPHALAEAVLAARKEQEDFARRLIPLLSERFPPEMTHPLASVLSGLGMPEGTDNP
ncbi:hypothetical protein BO221_11390 [Archangium sp. Cb G35]|uniref:hypothetical protein n=1 Tax=Archangium sp. Cb G35 TaxID=1920190 RepID=UPI0009367974|nr:hypothetical protein [Archangium sp. Cb G35]OJT24984.1 hypothetical protein BO221_11390 [Archangium sp. Cb G35]